MLAKMNVGMMYAECVCVCVCMYVCMEVSYDRIIDEYLRDVSAGEAAVCVCVCVFIILM